MKPYKHRKFRDRDDSKYGCGVYGCKEYCLVACRYCRTHMMPYFMARIPTMTNDAEIRIYLGLWIN